MGKDGGGGTGICFSTGGKSWDFIWCCLFGKNKLMKVAFNTQIS